MSFSLHCSHTCITISSSLQREHLLPLRFQIPNRNHANPILSLKLNQSLQHSCFIFQYDTIYFFQIPQLPNRMYHNSILYKSLLSLRGHVVVQWLRHCATNWKDTGSIPDDVIGIFNLHSPSPDDVIGIFNLHSPSGRAMALGSTQPLTRN
jgi:hypothetical protein